MLFELANEIKLTNTMKGLDSQPNNNEILKVVHSISNPFKEILCEVNKILSACPLSTLPVSLDAKERVNKVKET